MKQICLLGGNGYIGSQLYHTLNHYITSIDTCWFGEDLRYSKKIDIKTIGSDFLSKFDTILLFAGHSSVKMCNGTLLDVWKNNVTNFNNIAELLSNNQTLIYASSGSVYGMNCINAHEDQNDFLPVNNYDLSKYMLDLYAEKYITKGKKIIGLRLGTVNGYSLNLRNELMINSMVVNGEMTKGIKVNNLTINRPILGMNDLCRAISAIIDNPIPGIYNLASFNSTVDEISDSVAKTINVPRIVVSDTNNAYNFSMNTEKFTKTYNFNFTDTVESIVKSLHSKKYYTSNRDKFINYD